MPDNKKKGSCYLTKTKNASKWAEWIGRLFKDHRNYSM